jgi:hypothetical protein
MNADEFIEFLLQEKIKLSNGQIDDLERYKKAEAKLVERIGKMNLKSKSNIVIIDEFTETSGTFGLALKYIKKAMKLKNQKMPETSCFVMERNSNFPQATFRCNTKEYIVESGGDIEVSNYWRSDKAFNTGVSKPDDPMEVTGYAKVEHYNSPKGLYLRKKLREIAQNASQVV